MTGLEESRSTCSWLICRDFQISSNILISWHSSLIPITQRIILCVGLMQSTCHNRCAKTSENSRLPLQKIERLNPSHFSLSWACFLRNLTEGMPRRDHASSTSNQRAEKFPKAREFEIKRLNSQFHPTCTIQSIQRRAPKNSMAQRGVRRCIRHLRIEPHRQR